MYAVVGTNAARARNLHMGRYTNLSIKLDLDLSGLGQICENVQGVQDLPLNLCNNPELASCVTRLLNADPNNLPGSVGAVQGAPELQQGRHQHDLRHGGIPDQLEQVCDALSGLPLTCPRCRSFR